ncbi:MAG: pilus assembly protein TadG-related protein, partial [Actinobacteria bacterium]|nr:pilus assembly protein TadG-related protein [Actinomycetota bacterium]
MRAPRFLARLRKGPSLWERLCWRGPDGERGSFLVLAAIFSVLIVGSTALAVDVSKVVATKRSLQEAVDLSALDAVRALGDRLGQVSGLNPQQHATKLAQDSLKANGFNTADPSVVTSYSVTLGKYNAATKTLDTAGTPQDGVQVQATISRKFAFAAGSRTYTATGVASVSSNAGIAVGSFLLRLGGQDSILDSLLGGLLGGSLDLSLVSYQNLAAAQVSLGQLRTAMNLSVGTVDDLLAAQVTLPTMLGGIQTALSNQGATTLAANVGMLKLAAASNSTQVKLGDLVSVASGVGNDALDVGLNVLG